MQMLLLQHFRPRIVLVNFQKVATKSAKKLLKRLQKIGKVATEFQKVATYNLLLLFFVNVLFLPWLV